MPEVKEAPRYVEYKARRCPACNGRKVRMTTGKGDYRAYRCNTCLWTFKARIV